MTLAEEIRDVVRAAKQMERERVVGKFRELAQSLLDMVGDFDDEYAEACRDCRESVLRVCGECEE